MRNDARTEFSNRVLDLETCQNDLLFGTFSGRVRETEFEVGPAQGAPGRFDKKKRPKFAGDHTFHLIQILQKSIE